MAALAVRVWRQRVVITGQRRNEDAAGRAGDMGQRRNGDAAGRAGDAGQDECENVPRFDMAFWMLLFAAVGYFIAVSKTALLLGNTSNRYQLPIYGIAVLLIVYACSILWRQAVSLADVRRAAGEEKKPDNLWGGFVSFLIRHRKVTEKAAIAFCPVIVVSGYLFAEVVFLYPEAGEAVALARERAAADIPVVYVYRPGEEWCIWAVADELMEYERVYFAASDSAEPITEPAIANADTLVAYLPNDDYEDGQEQSMRISASCHASWMRLQYRHPYCESWYFYDDETAADGGDNP